MSDGVVFTVFALVSFAVTVLTAYAYGSAVALRREAVSTECLTGEHGSCRGCASCRCHRRRS